MFHLISYLLNIPGIIIAFGLHEYVKAMASVRLGDTLPAREGRCTLNLFKHIDPLGFIFALLFMLGWSKPVNTSAVFYKDRKKCTLIVYTLPLITNILLALIFLCGAKILYADPLSFTNIYIYQVLIKVAEINIIFAIFSLVPVYPLDGAKILSVFLKPNTVIKMTQYEKILQIILVLFILMGLMGQIIFPLANTFIQMKF